MTTANAAERSASPQEGLLARHPLISFFVMAYAFSWLMFLPGVLAYYGALKNVSPSIISSLGIAGLLRPILSGFIMTAVTEGRAGVRHWLHRIVRWRVGIR